MNSKPNKSVNNNLNMMLGTLYIVATPIGNLKDITLRALEILKAVDFIACEDTRITAKLLNHYGIKAKTLKYHEHSTPFEHNKIIDLLKRGENIALVSDAGTPLISDPGYKLINDVRNSHIKIVPIPGVSSLTTALSISPLSISQFYYIGFLPPTKNALAAVLEEYKKNESTLICFESPKRLLKTLALIKDLLGDRKIVVARELTKIFEEVLFDNISEMIEIFTQKTSVKGEFVLLIEGCANKQISEREINALLIELLKTQSLKSAVEEISTNYKVNRKLVYKLALAQITL